MKNYKTIYCILNNKLEQLYVSHEEIEMKGDEWECTIFICGFPNERIPVNYFKRDKKSPRLRVIKHTCLL